MEPNNDKTVYKLMVEDLQSVADDILERKLTDKEIELIEDKLGDFIDWYDAVENTINYLGIEAKGK